MEIKECRWSRPSLIWLFLLLVIVTFIALQPPKKSNMYISLEKLEPDPTPDKDSLKGYLIKTPGCRIPHMDPFDSTIKKFIKKPKQPLCNNGTPPLFASNLTSIFLLDSSLVNYTDQDADALDCCYRPFFREQPKKNEDDNKIKFSNNCVAFNGSTIITDEFIKVECKVNGSVVYIDFFSFVPLKNRTGGNAREGLNVLIIGLDAVSRLNFHRQMPKTLSYLKNMSAVELFGYNKVGDNTFPNLIPVLTGLSEAQLKEVCWNDKNENRFDGCPFIWKDYKAKGYVTSFGEDSSWMGIFNYLRKGFKKQPTDYTWGIFNEISEEEIGNSHNMNVQECVGAREVYKVFLDYITNFVIRMDSVDFNYFAFYWSASLTHDYLNKPKLGDNAYYNFLKTLKDSSYLNNTVMILMSDHGIRWGDIRRTYQGQMEERLPFIFMVLPEWYKRQYLEEYRNLIKNTRRLTTPYDLHETLKDFLDCGNCTHHDRRGISLLREISENRTCESAEIGPHWCTCQQSIEIDKNDSVVLKGAEFAVDSMNEKLEKYEQCARLTLLNITDARMMAHDEKILKGNHIKDYIIIIETVPGNGIFEITLRSSMKHKRRSFSVMGTISRLNLYGEQSKCILDFHLKLYCFCKSLLLS